MIICNGGDIPLNIHLMNNLFQSIALEEIYNRIDQLSPSSQRNWGKMSVSQMMAHCSAALQMAVGETKPPRLFIGRVLAPFFKAVYTNEKPFGKNSPTDKSFIVADERDFEMEKEKLKALLNKFFVGGATKCTTHPHPFFGNLNPNAWSIGMYKHMDHHLRQFGV